MLLLLRNQGQSQLCTEEKVDQNGWSGPETLPSLILGEKVEITPNNVTFFVCLFVPFVVVIGFCCLLFVLSFFFSVGNDKG